LIIVVIPVAIVVAIVSLPWVNGYLTLIRGEGIHAKPVPLLPFAVAMIAAFVAVTAPIGDDWHLLPLLVGTTALVSVSATDVRSYRIANRILFPSLAASLATMVIISLAPGDLDDLGRALIGAAVFSGLLGVIRIISPAGMGFGDVKLALLLGLLLGWVATSGTGLIRLLAAAMLVASLLGVVNGMLLATLRRVTGKNLLPDPDADPDAPPPAMLKTHFPFGPGLAFGTVFALALHESIVPGL